LLRDRDRARITGRRPRDPGRALSHPRFDTKQRRRCSTGRKPVQCGIMQVRRQRQRQLDRAGGRCGPGALRICSRSRRVTNCSRPSARQFSNGRLAAQVRVELLGRLAEYSRSGRSRRRRSALRDALKIGDLRSQAVWQHRLSTIRWPKSLETPEDSVLDGERQQQMAAMWA